MDNLLDKLLTYTESIEHMCLAQLRLKRLTYRERMINNSHFRAMRIKSEAKLIDSDGTKEQWNVKSESIVSKSYLVVFDGTKCNDHCRLKCKICQMCFHEATCNCADYQIRSNLCKHIHFVCQFKSSITTHFWQQVNGNEANESNEQSVEQVTTHVISKADGSIEQSVEQVTTHVIAKATGNDSQIVSNETVQDGISIHREGRSNFELSKSHLQALVTKLLEQCVDEDTMAFASRALVRTINAIKAMSCKKTIDQSQFKKRKHLPQTRIFDVKAPSKRTKRK